MSATATPSFTTAPQGNGFATWRDVVIELPGLAPVPTRVYGERKRGQVMPLETQHPGSALVPSTLGDSTNL